MKVRILVAVKPTGDWVSLGGEAQGRTLNENDLHDIMRNEGPYSLTIIEADVSPCPTPVVTGQVAS